MRQRRDQSAKVICVACWGWQSVHLLGEEELTNSKITSVFAKKTRPNSVMRSAVLNKAERLGTRAGDGAGVGPENQKNMNAQMAQWKPSSGGKQNAKPHVPPMDLAPKAPAHARHRDPTRPRSWPAENLKILEKFLFLGHF